METYPEGGKESMCRMVGAVFEKREFLPEGQSQKRLKNMKKEEGRGGAEEEAVFSNTLNVY